MFLVVLMMFAMPQVRREVAAMPRDVFMKVAGIGFIVALHWLFFYGAIVASNASIGVMCISTLAVFTAFIEPLMLGRQLSKREVLFGLMVVPGMALIVRFTMAQYWLGLGLGIIAAILSAIFSIMNKQMLAKATPLAIMFVEMLSGWLLLCIVVPVYHHFNPMPRLVPEGWHWWVYIAFAIFSTLIPYILSLTSLRHISPFVSNLSFNLEPVYGVILAAFLFHEHKDLYWGFYVGLGIILAAVFLYPWVQARLEKRNAAKE